MFLVNFFFAQNIKKEKKQNISIIKTGFNKTLIFYFGFGFYFCDFVFKHRTLNYFFISGDL